jgi:hypothetical protein
MVGEAGLKPHGACMDDGLVAHGRKGLISVDDRITLPQDNRPEYRKKSIERWRGRILKDDMHWHMIDLESISQTPDPAPTTVGVCNNDNFVSSLN